MRNFWRVVRIALRYRWTLAGVLVSALAVAVLWGSNLGTVYPIMGVVMKQRSLPAWVDESIAVAQNRSATLQARIDALRSRPASVADSHAADRHRQILQLEAQKQAEDLALARAEWLRPWIHHYLPTEPFPTLVLVVAVLLLGTSLKTVFLVASVILVERLTQLVTFDLRNLLYRRTISRDLSHFGQDRTSTLLSHFTHDLEGITYGVRTIFGRAIREPLKVAACLIGAAFVCWRLLLFCLIVTPLALYCINRLSRSVKRANRRAMDEMAAVYSQLSESFNGIHIVKAFTMERFERAKMHLRCRDYLHRALRIALYTSLTKPLSELMGIGIVSLAILTGGYLVLNQETTLFGWKMCDRPMTFESLMTFFALLAGVSDPFQKLAEVYNQLQRGSAAADRVYRLIDRPATGRRPTPSLPCVPQLETLEFRRVGFQYQAGHPVLHDIQLTVHAGQRIAIVGPNGCGKSSLMNLIPRFYEPTTGSLHWNGHDVRDLRVSQLRKKIGLVTQQTTLFDDTVLNNIRYGSPHASDVEVAVAARKAHAHRFIADKLPDGYYTHVGQGGKFLSGGQRQRIALARAILRNPELLILDEATSQIDPESEQAIHQALQEFMQERTTFMITHRLSTLALADHVLVLDAGRIVDFGGHEELLDRCRLYQRIHQAGLRESA